MHTTMTGPTPSDSSSSSSWWSTVASPASWSRRLLPSLLLTPTTSTTTPPSSSSYGPSAIGPCSNHHQTTASRAPSAPPPPPPPPTSDHSSHDDAWQVVLTNHGHTSDLDGSSCPMVMPESQFVQLPQMQPIHGLIVEEDDGVSDLGSDTDDDEFVARTLPSAGSPVLDDEARERVGAAPPPPLLAVAADPAVASPIMLPSFPLTTLVTESEPTLMATMDAYSLLHDSPAHDQQDSSNDSSDESEVEMSIDQLVALTTTGDSPAFSASRSPNSASPSQPTLSSDTPQDPSPSSTALSTSGILVPIPTWAWHVILGTPTAAAADMVPIDTPKPTLPTGGGKKSKSRFVASNQDLRRLASCTRESLAARGCMGRFQRQHGPQPSAAQQKKRVGVAAGQGGKRVAAKSAI